ncbi:DUF5808 domain-containing protein [Nocardia sp. R16R-3T]
MSTREPDIPEPQGAFLSIPYDWRKPTRQRFRARMWNPADGRILTPRAYGWGYSLNFYRLLHPRSNS